MFAFPPAPKARVLSHTLNPAFSSLIRSEEHTSELQSLRHLVCRLLLEKKKKIELQRTEPSLCRTVASRSLLIPRGPTLCARLPGVRHTLVRLRALAAAQIVKRVATRCA